MTALVGFLCRDGVVIGADSAATSSAPTGRSAIPTIEQEVKKVWVISDRVIVAGTGAVGLGQRFCDEVRKFHDEDKGFANSTKNNAIHSASELCKRACINFSNTGVEKGGYGALVGFAFGGKSHLVEFALADFQPEFKTHDMCFVSMGGGQLITDSFLGLLRRVFFRNEVPTVAEAIFYTAWTLHQVIDLNPGGIKGPMQISVLRDNGRGELKASILNADEVAEHLDHIRGVERHLADYRRVMTSSSATAPIPDIKR